MITILLLAGCAAEPPPTAPPTAAAAPSTTPAASGSDPGADSLRDAIERPVDDAQTVREQTEAAARERRREIDAATDD